MLMYVSNYCSNSIFVFGIVIIQLSTCLFKKKQITREIKLNKDILQIFVFEEIGGVSINNE